MTGPDYAALRAEADYIRTEKVLALGRWRYIHKLSQRACGSVADDAEASTERAVHAYARHFKGMLFRNGIDISPEMLQQIDAGGRMLLERASTEGRVGAKHEAELCEIVNPVRVHERQVGTDDDGNAMFVVDMKVEDTLEKMLQVEGLARQATTPHWPEEGLLREPRDGLVFKEHPLFRSDPGAFAFQLYAGECTPLNAHTLTVFLVQMITSCLIPLALPKGRRSSRRFTGGC